LNFPTVNLPCSCVPLGLQSAGKDFSSLQLVGDDSAGCCVVRLKRTPIQDLMQIAINGCEWHFSGIAGKKRANYVRLLTNELESCLYLLVGKDP